MKKVLIGLGIFIGVVIVGFYICKFTGMYRLHTCVTMANEPALPLNSMFATSNLKDEKSGDLITFQQDTAVYIFRLVAKEGDVVLIKNGRLFVNDADFDSKVATKHSYLVSAEQLLQLNPQPYAIPNPNGKYAAFLEDAVADKAGLAQYKYVAPQNEPDPHIVKIYGKGWNKDFFGPLTIPKNKVFVLGDNRDNAYDSRYLGLIDTDKITGVVLKK
ncbi:signal peptidase I [Flavobacterium zepuense]|uniref:Signal peptidase I n=1 Tax=Flavobacterium zepuense TaxID=2593302 RepID=A0A552V5T5_9FLAO|nr:signal peptidase I [Flavobacterium zepuense]TRW25818.1 signal peptidase I [Flavobacterium zepuense]